MTAEEVQRIVERDLASWRPPVVKAGETMGIPWTSEQYVSELERLRASLVRPYRQRFELRETDDPEQKRVRGQGEYWVVAATGDMYLWYDETSCEFGVGEPGSDGELPQSIGLRGDIVGSFCAW